jgi:hypothetical protein
VSFYGDIKWTYTLRETVKHKQRKHDEKGKEENRRG